MMRAYPHHVPIMVHMGPLAPKPLKFLVPDDVMLSGLVDVIRRRVKLKPAEALYVFVGPHLLPLHNMVTALPRGPDGLAHVQASTELTLG